MKIVSVEVFAADVRLHEPFVISTMTVDVAKSVFVRVRCDSGLFGWGEANPYWRIVGETQSTSLAAAREFAGLLLGKDPLDVEARLADLRGFLAHNRTTLSAFDMALHDVLGKAAGLPLHALLGGAPRPFATDRTVGLASPEKMVENALAFRARGFPAVKVKIGTTAEADLARVRQIRAAIGSGVPLRIDANQGYDETTATRVLRALESCDVEYCEQPIPAWDVDGLARIRAKTSIPLMADEAVFDSHDAWRVAKSAAADYLNVKLSKSGGVREALAVEAVASAAGLGVAMGCMTETRLGLTAAAHVVCARRAFRFADLDGADFLAEDPILGGMTIDERGVVTTPTGPGLGVDVDPTFLKRCPVVTIK
jgi:L-Ala-D/L-Glu epimerase